MKVKAILDSPADEIVGKEVLLQGWVRTLRTSGKSLAFVEVNDGSSRKGLQAVCNSEGAMAMAASSSSSTTSSSSFASTIGSLSTGCSVSIKGTVVLSQGKGQAYELQASEVELVGACPEDYPLQKKVGPHENYI
jgi:asparaginyl-tRNA synthetase